MCLIIQSRGTGLNPRLPVTAPPPATPPGLSVRGPLLQAPSLLVITGIMHRRRRLPPEHHRPVTLLQLLVDLAEVGQGQALAVPVAGLPEDLQRLLVAGDASSNCRNCE